ncbi:MAG: hypothetical protein HDR03_06865 [Lachnospiraceae bacterium]|nr:hypothetical protein [Lachnospiraceae bacterium]
MKIEISEIVQLIIEYTRQVEKYESVSTYYSAICLGGICATILFITYLLVRRQKESAQEIFDKAISTLCLLPPVITTLYLYTFAMNMRKVAMFRGYLGYLENLMNSMADYPVITFDRELVTQFLGAGSFPVNGLGPVVMGIFVILSLVAGFCLSTYFRQKVTSSEFKKWQKIIFYVVLIVCVLFDIVCVYYLSINDRVVDEVLQQGVMLQ